ncbi:unnamed protein product, partial [marine sediment metagenome]
MTDKGKNKATVLKAQNAVLAEMDKLADERFGEDDIAHEGQRMVLPTSMSKKEAVGVLLASIDAEDKKTDFDRRFMYRPWDVAAAFEKAVRKITGT